MQFCEGRRNISVGKKIRISEDLFFLSYLLRKGSITEEKKNLEMTTAICWPVSAYKSSLSTLHTLSCSYLVSQSCPPLWEPMEHSLPDSSVHGIFQARILEWIAISSSRGSSQTRDWTCISRVSCTGRILYHGVTWEY